ncbi:hypothetical protein HAX54_050643 [Datura stramonium]|uniref:Uncharacterized protein n=1 Tax=Datura stramonium TaxID=4076 RepID=A0ABS8WQG8_DATST|nr:hypothetical protein [Datura stramonium]
MEPQSPFCGFLSPTLIITKMSPLHRRKQRTRFAQRHKKVSPVGTKQTNMDTRDLYVDSSLYYDVLFLLAFYRESDKD